MNNLIIKIQCFLQKKFFMLICDMGKVRAKQKTQNIFMPTTTEYLLKRIIPYDVQPMTVTSMQMPCSGADPGILEKGAR